MTIPLSEIKRLMEKASPSPWEQTSLGYEVWNAVKDGRGSCCCIAEGRPENNSLIVAMRNAMPAIVARLEALEKVAQAARKAIDGIDKWERFESIGSDRLEDWEDVERALAALDNDPENTPRIIPQNYSDQAGQGAGK
jgi:hypothetical protein